MTIKHIIIHQLSQPPGSELLTATPADQSLPLKPALETMLDDLLQTYNKKSDQRYGYLDSKVESTFPQELKSYLDDQLDFLTFSQQSLNKLADSLNQAGAFGGGYVLIADYKQGLTHYLLMCMLTSHSSITVTDDLTIQDVAYLDTGKMPLACRINLTEWRNNESSQRYLSFLRPKGGKRLSDVFQSALGCSDQGGSKEEADSLVKTVQEYASEAPSPENHREISRQVYNFCQTKLNDGDSLTLEELTGHLSESGDNNFARFVNTRDYDMSQPMTPEKRVLTKLIRYSGRSKGLTLAFDAELLGKQVIYNPEIDQLVIKGVPEKLKEQLKNSSYAPA